MTAISPTGSWRPSSAWSTKTLRARFERVSSRRAPIFSNVRACVDVGNGAAVVRWLENGDDGSSHETGSRSLAWPEGGRAMKRHGEGRNQHGHLAIRVRWQGRDDHVGTKLKDDGVEGRNRKLVEAGATLIAEDLRRGKPPTKPPHKALMDHLEACPLVVLAGSGTPVPSRKVADGRRLLRDDGSSGNSRRACSPLDGQAS